MYVVGSKISGLTYKSRAKWQMLRGIYSDIYVEVNVSVSGGYVIHVDYTEKITKLFYFCHPKNWSGRKRLDLTTYKLIHNLWALRNNNVYKSCITLYIVQSN